MLSLELILELIFRKRTHIIFWGADQKSREESANPWSCTTFPEGAEKGSSPEECTVVTAVMQSDPLVKRCSPQFVRTHTSQSNAILKTNPSPWVTRKIQLKDAHQFLSPVSGREGASRNGNYWRLLTLQILLKSLTSSKLDMEAIILLHTGLYQDLDFLRAF